MWFYFSDLRCLSRCMIVAQLFWSGLPWDFWCTCEISMHEINSTNNSVFRPAPSVEMKRKAGEQLQVGNTCFCFTSSLVMLLFVLFWLCNEFLKHHDIAKIYLVFSEKISIIKLKLQSVNVLKSWSKATIVPNWTYT